MKKYVYAGVTVLLIAALLAAVFWWGGDSLDLHGWTAKEPVIQQNTAAVPAEQKNSAENNAVKEEKAPPAENKEIEVLPDEPPEPVAPPAEEQTAEQPETTEEEGLYCYLSVECSEILNHLDRLSAEKHVLIPENGTIFPETKVTFHPGESVFHVLRRELKKAKIHLEFTMTPVFNTAYIEGINNLYEFDCGERSGWLYSVNGTYPNYGCSNYTVQNGDKICWVYTCDFGRDVSGYYGNGEEE